mgnify:FL=1|tara:strand:+ start:1011 stop:1313 length:303 start_codon:yes stop_codon:yes gene_type:complete
MENSVEPKAFQLPLELQFSMRKAEMKASEMNWDQLYLALLSLYHQRLMEWHALKSLMAEENVDIDFDVPTDIELLDLVSKSQELIEEELDDEEGEEPLSI